MKNDFRAKLKKVIRSGIKADRPSQKVVSRLDEVADAVQAVALPNVKVEVVPDLASGSTYHVRVAAEVGYFLLLRAVIPEGGYPAQIGYNWEDLLSVRNDQEFQDEILSILARPSVKGTLSLYTKQRKCR